MRPGDFARLFNEARHEFDENKELFCSISEVLLIFMPILQSALWNRMLVLLLYILLYNVNAHEKFYELKARFIAAPPMHYVRQEASEAEAEASEAEASEAEASEAEAEAEASEAEAEAEASEAEASEAEAEAREADASDEEADASDEEADASDEEADASEADDDSDSDYEEKKRETKKNK